MNRCIHFRGIQNVCEAGVDPKTVRDDSGPGPYKWPCLTLPGRPQAVTGCARLRVMTADEINAEREMLIKAAEAFEDAIAAGRCGVCGATVERRERVGRCDYARPCGHRLGQAADAPGMP